MKKILALSLLATVGFVSHQVSAGPLEVAPGTCDVKIMKNNGNWEVRAIINNEGQTTPSIRTGKLRLAKAQPLIQYGFKVLESSDKKITLVGVVHDGGAEDGKPRMLDAPIIFVGVEGNSCTNATVSYAGQ